MVKLAPGQVYHIYSNGVKMGQVILDRLAETTIANDEMWYTIGGCGVVNATYYVQRGCWKLYSQHPFNGRGQS